MALPRAGLRARDAYAKLAEVFHQEGVAMVLRRAREVPLAFVLGLSVLCGAARADGPDVRALMTPEEFRAAGLDKLSPQEIEALNRWVVAYTAKDAPEVRKKDVVVQAEVKKVDADGIKTRIVGDFRGWDGNTVFRLENGQVWKQRLAGQWFYRAQSPEVILRKNLLGYWTLKVVAADHSIGVTRLE